VKYLATSDRVPVRLELWSEGLSFNAHVAVIMASGELECVSLDLELDVLDLFITDLLAARAQLLEEV